MAASLFLTGLRQQLLFLTQTSEIHKFGGERAYRSLVGNRYKFTGKERDNESGLDNFGARFDSSSMGRFMSPDPVIVSWRRMVNPQLWNSYSYAGNNPLRYVDPTGEEIVALGVHTDEEIKKRKAEIKQELKNKDLTKEQREDLKKEMKTLSLEPQGNHVVSGLLANLDKTEERNGLTLKDFSLTTDTKNDFAGKVPPEKMKEMLNAQAFASAGGPIYIRTEEETGFYQMSQRSQDYSYYGASALSHEQVHTAGFRESMAYQRQLGVFEGFKNFFQSKALYGDMDAQIKKAWEDNKNN